MFYNLYKSLIAGKCAELFDYSIAQAILVAICSKDWDNNKFNIKKSKPERDVKKIINDYQHLNTMSYEQLSQFTQEQCGYPLVVYQADINVVNKHSLAVLYPDNFDPFPEGEPKNDYVAIIRVVDQSQNTIIGFYGCKLVNPSGLISLSKQKIMNTTLNKLQTPRQYQKSKIKENALKNGPSVILPNEIDANTATLPTINDRPCHNSQIYFGSDQQDVNSALTTAFGLTPANYNTYANYSYNCLLNYTTSHNAQINIFKQGQEQFYDFFKDSIVAAYNYIITPLVLKKNNRRIFKIDANSMYPHVLNKYKYPDLKSLEWIDDFNEVLSSDINGEFGYMVECEYKAPSDTSYINESPLTLIKDKVKDHNEAILNEGKCVQLAPTIQLMNKYGYTIKPIRILKYSQSHVFLDYFDKLYKLRQQNPTCNKCIKGMLNSATGMLKRNPMKGRITYTEKSPIHLYTCMHFLHKYEMYKIYFAMKEQLSDLHLCCIRTDSYTFYCDDDISAVRNIKYCDRLLIGDELGQFKFEKFNKSSPYTNNDTTVYAFCMKNIDERYYITDHTTIDEYKEFNEAAKFVISGKMKNNFRNNLPFDSQSLIVTSTAH